MGQLYVLKLQNNKWYVGYTDRGIVRVLEQLQNKGKFKAAKWTQKYRPVSWQNAVVELTGDGKTLEDEDQKTLEMMREHGVRNVRGGQWCKVRMTRREIANLEKMAAKTKPKKIRKVTCGKCGRTGHNKLQCYAKTTVDGKKIVSDIPKSKPERKKRVSRRAAKAIAQKEAYEALRKRGVFCEDASMNLNVRGMWRSFNRHSEAPELSDPEWFEVLKHNHSKFGSRPLVTLYPPEHWFHDPELFDKSLSKKFEEAGYLWTASGAAVNPKIHSLQVEAAKNATEQRRLEKEKVREQRRLEKEKAREQRRLEKEARQKEIEREQELEKKRLRDEKEVAEKYRLECFDRLRKRGVLIEHSMATTLNSFVRNLKQNRGVDESSAKWLDYFKTVTKNVDLSILYPPDHWMHEPEKFNRLLSEEFEYDGFGWTESGYAARNPDPPKNKPPDSSKDDSSTEIVDVIFQSITKEIEKAGKTVSEEIVKLTDEFRKRTGL